jgi:hypothetical protein
MSDLAILIHNLENRLAEIRRELPDDDWAAFTRLLAEAAPFFEQATTDDDARLEAIYRLRHACIQFPVTRGVMPAPGGLIPEPPPPPAPGQESGIPAGLLAQKDLDVVELMQRGGRLCRHPDAVADEREHTARPSKE